VLLLFPFIITIIIIGQESIYEIKDNIRFRVADTNTITIPSSTQEALQNLHQHSVTFSTNMNANSKTSIVAAVASFKSSLVTNKDLNSDLMALYVPTTLCDTINGESNTQTNSNCNIQITLANSNPLVKVNHYNQTPQSLALSILLIACHRAISRVPMLL